MKYTIQTLDGRFKYQRWFQYYVGFSNNMGFDLGPEQYNHALKWCMDTYGWSAEVREYENIHHWYQRSVPFISSKGVIKRPPTKLPECCNSHWSWSNGISNLRIYLASDAELLFFQLRFPAVKN